MTRGEMCVLLHMAVLCVIVLLPLLVKRDTKR
jgi:hypothetical protein